MTKRMAGVKKKLRLAGGQSGQTAFMTVLVLLILGGLIIVPLLGFTISGLKQGQAHEERTHEFYAADAGVEDAMWKIRNDALPDGMQGPWDDMAYHSGAYSYAYDLPQLNDKDLTVEINRMWLLQGHEDRSVPFNDKVTVVGSVVGPGKYEIAIIDAGVPGGLKIERIGCWLPAGFSYVSGSGNLGKDPSQPPVYKRQPTTSDFGGGQTIIWEYSPAIEYSKLPGTADRKTITFDFTPATAMTGSFSWIRMDVGKVGYLSYDLGLSLYEIKSTAVDPVTGRWTTLTAYTAKEEFRSFGTVIYGDYQATGQALARDPWTFAGRKKGRRYAETPAEISGIPAGAEVERVLLYWTGWKNTPWDAWYDDKPVDQWSEADQRALLDLVNTARVNQVQLKVEAGGTLLFNQTITASRSQVLPNGTWTGNNEHGWSYSCYADVTDVLMARLKGKQSTFTGNGKYTLGHAAAVVKPADETGYALYEWKGNHGKENVAFRTDYPLSNTTQSSAWDSLETDELSVDEWANGGWSIVVIYSSPETRGHQLYIYDTLRYLNHGQKVTFNVENFLAPQDVLTDPEAVRLTCFVGEGDDYVGDNIRVNDHYLSDTVNPWNNVWNSRSNVSATASSDGIDLDTYAAGNGVIRPGDIRAQVSLGTGGDVWNLVYIVLSFRSEKSAAGLLGLTLDTG